MSILCRFRLPNGAIREFFKKLPAPDFDSEENTTMSTLKIFPENDPSTCEVATHYDDIAGKLHSIGVRFEHWDATQALTATSTDEDILGAYRDSVDRLMKEYDFKSVDVVSLRPDHPNRAELRNKFLDEHTHSDFEVRFFVDGRGLFSIHTNGHVYAVLCEQGDLISVPANTRHWFDMGAAPSFKCIRLFTTPEGWVAQYTGDNIARRFPTFDKF
jgi:1,2-dihydroxy-3-keto-5-methylthiopentene dioxygenase